MSYTKIKDDLNQFRSQSAQDHRNFLENYYKNKTQLNKLELDSRIADLDRKLNDKISINNDNTTIKTEAMATSNTNNSNIITSTLTKALNTDSIYTLSSTVSSYITNNFNKLKIKNGLSQSPAIAASSSSSGVNSLQSSLSSPLSSPPIRINNNNNNTSSSSSSNHNTPSNTSTDLSTIDADTSANSSYQDIDVSFPLCLVKSNRLDIMGNSFYADENDLNNDNNNGLLKMTESSNTQSLQYRKNPSNSIKISNNDNISEDFIFLPDNRNIERFSIMSYEVLSKSEGIHIDNTIHIKEFAHLTVDQQSYKCASCDRTLNNVKKTRRCHYYGKLYCKICHLNYKYVIPAKLIHNLDTKKYAICENARHILDSVFRKPIFDIVYDNSELYVKSALLNDCRRLRMELEHLRWYLHTCQNKQSKNVFIMHLWPDDYLYETIHLYSLYDLINLKDIYTKLKSARDYAFNHIMKECVLCIQKGFICEFCKSDSTIYPFQLDSVTQCGECGSVYHKECRSKSEFCLKCQRLTNRQ